MPSIPNENSLFDPTPDVLQSMPLPPAQGKKRALARDAFEQALWAALLEESLAQNPSDEVLEGLTNRFPIKLAADRDAPAATDQDTDADEELEEDADELEDDDELDAEDEVLDDEDEEDDDQAEEDEGTG